MAHTKVAATNTSSRRCITIPCTQNSTRGIVQDRTAGLARRRLWPRDKLQPETCSLPLRGPSTRQRYLPALCSSVMAFAPSSTSVGFATFIVTYTGSYRFLYGEHGPVMGCIFTILVASTLFSAEDIGSTPVLKIALPSSPLPEHRSDRRPRLVCYPQRQPTERTQGAGFKSILRGAVGVLTSTRNL